MLLLHPDAEYTLTQLAAVLDLPLTTVQREVTRLSSAHLIQERRIGRSRLVSADLSNRYARPLTELVTMAFGPQFVIGEEFASLGAVAVAIYGSWASRYDGIAGHPPNDIDVLVIGDVPRRDVYEAAERAKQRLGLPVNPVLCSVPRWLEAPDPLIQQVRTAPLVWVAGQEPTEGGKPMKWSTGESTVERLLADGRIERVQGAQADGESWLAARQACVGALAQQGLRPTTAGGHYAIEEVIRAQFGPALRTFGGLRRRRNELEYPLYPTEQADEAEAAETLQTAAEVIEAVAKLLPNLGFY